MNKTIENFVRAGFAYLLSIVVGLVVLSGEKVLADQPSVALSGESEAAVTRVREGFSIGLSGRSMKYERFTTNDISLEDKLVFVVWTTNDPAWIIVPSSLEYAYQVELFDTNGMAIPKTDLGETVGVKFFDFDAHPLQRGIETRRVRVGRKGELADALYLFYPHRANDLFQIDRPGKYTLRIRFQILVFPTTGLGSGKHTNLLVRFPALDFPLVKTLTSQTNRLGL